MNNEKYKYFLAVFNADKEKSPSIESARDFLSGLITRLLSYNNAEFIATIIHDKDILESGEMKTIHLHAFIQYHEKATKRAILAELSEYIGIDKGLISLEGSNSEFLGVQYLTHKNDTNKYQYPFSDISTNNQELLETRWNNIYIDPLAKVYDALKTSTTISQFIEKTDLNTGLKFRALFNQIKQEQGQNFEKIYHDYEVLIETMSEIYGELKELLDDMERLFLRGKQKAAIRNDINYDKRKEQLLSHFLQN